MRLLEIFLIVSNLLALVLCLRTQSTRTRCGLAGWNLLLFLLHAGFEGSRYQMLFSYGFVFLFVLAVLGSANTRRGIKLPTAIKVSASLLAGVGLALSAVLAYGLPVFQLPRPSGRAPVGVQYLHLVDQSRADPFLEPSTRPRELMIKIFYPSGPSVNAPVAGYFHKSPGLLGAFAQFYHLPGSAFDHLRLVKTAAREGLPLAPDAPSYPVILFSHGAGTSMEVHTAQCEDLASHGYIVVAIDHTYVSAATAFPGRLVIAQEATTDFHTAEPAEIITQIMARDVQFVIETLDELKAGQSASLFAGRLNLARIGVIGHSVGGAVAYDLALHDSRVRAAVNLDGRVYIAPQESSAMAPFLMLANDQGHIQALQGRVSLLQPFDELPPLDQEIALSMYGSQQAYTQAYAKAQQNVEALVEVLRRSGNLYTIQGCDHMKFSDIGLFLGSAWLREQIQIGGATSPAGCLEVTQALTVAFFDQNGEGAAALDWQALLAQYPELRRMTLQ